MLMFLWLCLPLAKTDATTFELNITSFLRYHKKASSTTIDNPTTKTDLFEQSIYRRNMDLPI